jgi:hypothetical protein
VEPVPPCRADEPTKEPPQASKIPKVVRFQGDVVEEALRIPAKSPFKRLILETPLWSYLYSKMNSNAKSPPEGLKASKAENWKSGARPPIPYVPPNNLIEKREGEKIKVKMPDGTNFYMAAFTSGTNKDYLCPHHCGPSDNQEEGIGRRNQGSLAGAPCRQEGNCAFSASSAR